MFRIGEFSKIAQVSGRLLRYYDALGLFKPTRIDLDTGYRYYSAKQLPELNRILALKELGLTLDQIARLIAGHIATDEIRGMLVMKKAEIEQTLREELTRIHYIESRINQIDDEGQLQDYEVVLKSVPVQRLIAAREPSTTLSACRTLVQEIGRFLPARIGGKALSHFAMIFHSDLWDSDGLDVELGFLLNSNLNSDMDMELALPNGKMMRVQELPAVETMATTMHLGIPESGHRSYAVLGRWAEANGYHFVSPSREIFIQPPYSSAEDEMVVEIQLPVKKTPEQD
ncbi:MAG: MerR family transcriptional regulator [Chloroflexota bacterium]